jgi:glycosyltransferase involved in cell wall biosynthesis
VAVPRDLGSQLPELLRSGWLRLMGHVEGHYSLAMVNRSLALALDDAMPGRVSLVPCDGEPYQSLGVLPVPATEDATLRRLCATVTGPDASPLVSIVHHYPLRSDPQAADLRCAIFFWEESVVPGPTIAQLNDGFDAVFVASRYVRKVLIDSGCRLPVAVIPLGLDAALLADEASAAAGGEASLRSLMPPPGGVFRFLHVSSAFPRKGVDALLAAYFATFTAAEAVELCIKTFANPHNTLDEQLASLRAAHPNPPRVVVDDQPRDPAAMRELYRSAQAVVLPTRGEGFNLPAAEALALGLPLIVTGHGGQSDFCTLDTACLLPFSHARSGSHLSSWGSCWVEPDGQALADALKAMREQVQTDDPALMSRRRLGREQVLGLHTAPRAAHAMLGTLEALWHERTTKAAVTRSRVALLSSWQAACGVADFVAQRVAGLVPSAGWELRVFCDERARPPVPGDVHEPSWRLGDQASVMSTLERIGREGCEVVIVQHQPAFFTLDAAVCKQLAAFQARGAVVIVELHAVAQIVSAQRLPKAAVQALRRVARIVVHQVDDLNLLLAMGLADNVTLLPLGVPEPWLLDEAPAVRQELKLPPDALVMASFGFAYPHKGIEALVRAIRPLTQALGRPVRLLSLNAAPNPAARGVIAEAQAVAQELGVAGEVVWINDFLPLEQSRRLLSASDCVVFPYGPTRESASAAVGIGLASLRPVLVSREPIFDEVRDIAWPMEGAEADAIVSAVVACQADAGALQSRLSTQRAWLADNSSRALAARLADMVAGLRRQHSLAAVLGEHWVDVDAQAGQHQLFVDVSEFFHRDARTGIQRVVRSLLARLQERPPSGYRVLPVWGTPSEPYRHTRRFTPEPGLDHPPESEPLRPQPGDVFLGLDLSAHLFPDGVKQLEAMHRAGVQIHYVVYDIIPISHPQWTAPGLTAAFVEWLRALAAHADALHCISAAVAQDVRGWLHVHAPSVAAPDIDHFMLGADIEESLPSTEIPAEADALLARLRRRPVFLMVGTLEPRKGHEQVIDAFELLWRMGEDVQLLIVGKQGWQIDALAERLRAHPEHGDRLHWVEGASDEYLQRLYGAANCLVAASHTEGFGLPLIEAARRGLPILARDIPVFREVASGHASYFTGTEPSDITHAVCIWLERAAAGATVPSTGMPWLTWQDSAEQLLRCMGLGPDEPPEVPIPQPIPQS